MAETVAAKRDPTKEEVVEAFSRVGKGKYCLSGNTLRYTYSVECTDQHTPGCFEVVLRACLYTPNTGRWSRLRRFNKGRPQRIAEVQKWQDGKVELKIHCRDHGLLIKELLKDFFGSPE